MITTDNPTPNIRPDAIPVTQPCQSTEGNCPCMYEHTKILSLAKAVWAWVWSQKNCPLADPSQAGVAQNQIHLYVAKS